jgi:two-component system chemotaxis response regulator CheB
MYRDGLYSYSTGINRKFLSRMSQQYNILVADDDVMSTGLLRKILVKAGHAVTIARNGLEALRLVQENSFDVVLVDWMMPELDGVEVIKKIRASVKPIPQLIMVTALASEESRRQAFAAGADDYIGKPIDRNLLLSALGHRNSTRQASSAYLLRRAGAMNSIVGVAIAASTGGPKALKTVFTTIQPTTEAAFFIVQHAPLAMLDKIADSLQNMTSMKVQLADDGITVRPGAVYIARGERHMVLEEGKSVLRITDDPPENFVRPAADPLFRSVARNYGPRSLGVILTGMGKDGQVGAGYIANAGGVVLVQNPDTATQPSMPHKVISVKIVCTIVPLENMGKAISDAIKELARLRV